MLNKIIQAVKTIFEETPEEKASRELIEKNIKTQENIISNIKCPICNGYSFHRGYIASTGGAYGGGSVNMVDTYHTSYNIEYENKVQVCDMCGYVMLFADFRTQRKQEKKNIRI